MDSYTAFFGFAMFMIGTIVGRITMAIQYAVMKQIPPPIKKKYTIPEVPKDAPSKTEQNAEHPGKKDFYDYWNRNI